MRTKSLWLWVAIAGFVATAVFINPLRQTTLDDDWAYALTVRGIVEGHGYQLHDWAAANMPFQAYLGAAFSSVFGYSSAVLRVVTLFSALIGLIAFYKLAREHDLDERQAGLLTLMWLASPLLLRLSYSFMTDVTFVSWLVVALWLYSRGMRTGSAATMLAASVAASACILTRQFGMALVAGVAVVWLSDRDLRARLGWRIAVVALPAAAAVWQLAAGFGNPTWAQTYARAAQSLYMDDLLGGAMNVLWRPVVLMIYMALFLLPLAIPAVREALHTLVGRDSGVGRERSRMFPVAVVAGIVGIIMIGHAVLDTPRMMPYVLWNFDILKRFGAPGRAVVTIGTIGLAALFIRAILLTRVGHGTWHGAPVAGRLLFVTSLVLLALNIVFFKFGDEYLLGYIPFVLITVGYFMRSWLSRMQMMTAAAALLVLVGSAVWTRGLLAGEDAGWLLGEQMRRRGVAASLIHGTWNWNCYNGVFDEYLVSIQRRTMTDLDGFFTWYRNRQEGCRYVVTASPKAITDSSWSVLSRSEYRDFLLQRQYVYLLERK